MSEIKGKGIIQIPIDEILESLNIYEVEFCNIFINHRENTLDLIVQHKDLPMFRQGCVLPILKLETYRADGLNIPCKILSDNEKEIDCTYDYMINK